jgi:hypothetical protein
MPKKNFKNINPAMAFISDTDEKKEASNIVYDTQEVQHTHEEQQEHEAQDVQDACEVQYEQNAHKVQDVQIVQGTQGKKGQKLPRINMAFSPDNLEYLQIISRIEGKSITEYVNKLIRIDSSSRAEEVSQAKSVLKI